MALLVCMAGLAYYLSAMLRADLQRELGKQQFSTATQVAANIDRDILNRIRALQSVAAPSRRP